MGCHSTRAHVTPRLEVGDETSLYMQMLSEPTSPSEHVNSSESAATRLHAALALPQQMRTKTDKIQDIIIIIIIVHAGNFKRLCNLRRIKNP